ncbi:MAG: LPS export ABC transporter ATP-binding protein [Firmicutes bacterium]|nr:LPS export ABC transporter ATP-binding protein [Bacillota bacterium]
MSIKCSNIVKAYKEKVVVDHIDLEMARGEIVGLLGPNGAGKTTTFSIIVGLERADQGTIIVDDKDITHLPIYKRARLGVNFLPQEPSVFRHLTVEQNLLAILQLLKLNKKEEKDRLEQLLSDFKLQDVRKRLGYQLSGGERRRTEIARALALNPGFLLLDEPFAGVDPIAVAEVQAIVAELKQRNLGILITDHNVRETLKITDRAYIMHEGRILVSGSATSIAQNELARKFYLGDQFSI